jgi:hypothetical protein
MVAAHQLAPAAHAIVTVADRRRAAGAVRHSIPSSQGQRGQVNLLVVRMEHTSRSHPLSRSCCLRLAAKSSRVSWARRGCLHLVQLEAADFDERRSGSCLDLRLRELRSAWSPHTAFTSSECSPGIQPLPFIVPVVCSEARLPVRCRRGRGSGDPFLPASFARPRGRSHRRDTSGPTKRPHRATLPDASTLAPGYQGRRVRSPT